MLTKANTKLASLLPPNIALIIVGVFLGALCAFSIAPYLNLVEQLGFRINQDNMTMDYVVSLVWATFFGACIIFLPVSKMDKSMLLWAWLLKCFVSLFVLLFYENYYSLDSEGFFDRGINYAAEYIGMSVMDIFLKADTSPKAIFFVIANYKLVLPDIIGGSFHSLKISFSMVSLIATYLFYRAANIITKKKNRAFFWAILLFPSLLVHTSEVGKSSLVIFGLAVYAVGLAGWHINRKVIFLFLISFGLLACAFIRTWMAPILGLPLFFYFLYSNKNLLPKILCSLLLGTLVFYFNSVTLERLHIEDDSNAIYSKLERLQKENNRGGSAINRVPVEINGPLDVIKYAPSGIFTALFRPLPWDMPGLLGLLSGMEGLLLLYLFFRAMYRTRLKELNDPIVVWGVVLVLSWAMLYGFAIQNFATGLRWKTPILPIFLGLLLYLGRSRSKDLKPIGLKFLNLPELKK
jgi:hypothetical protein